MKKNKKAMILYYPIIIAFVITLCIFYFLSAYKNKPENTEFVGQVFLNSYKEMQNSFKDIYYIKKSAKYSIYNSIYSISKNAGYFNDPPCKYSPIPKGTNYVLWQKVNEEFDNYLPTGKFIEYACYPTESDIRKSFTSFFNKEFNDYAEKYTPTIIPRNNYDLILSEKEQNLEITGIATQKIRFPPDPTQYKEMVLSKLSEMEQNCLSKEGYTPIFWGGDLFRACAPCPEKANCGAYVNEIYCKIDPCNLGCRWDDGCKKATSIYAITPSFKTEINYNFIKKFNEYIEKAKAIEKSVEDCLRIGSGELYDIDIMVCTDLNKLKKEINGLENFEITALPPEDDTPLLSYPHIKIPSKKYYTLLFKVKDQSFQNHFSNEKFDIKFAIQSLDDTPPPATKILTDAENKPQKKAGAWYLRWETNPASDVLAYKIYYKKMPSSQPTSISEMDNKDSATIVWAPYTEWQIPATIEGDYYFFIIAIDKFNNEAKDIIPTKVNIPSIEEAKKEETLILPIY